LHAGVAVLAALLVAGVAGEELPLVNRQAEPLGIGPLDPLSDAALTIWGSLAGYTAALAGVVVAATAAAILPWLRNRSRHGVAALGAVLIGLSIATGAGLVNTIVLLLVWGAAAAVAGSLRRSG
jgi:hypothetical protein